MRSVIAEDKAGTDRRVYRARGQRRRSEILRAAVAEFSERGIEAVTIDEVAEVARCPKSLVFYYFSSKAELVEAVMTQAAEVTEAGLKAPASLSFPEWAGHVTTLWQEDEIERLIRLSVHEGLSRPDQVINEESRTRAERLSVDVVERAQDAMSVDPGLDSEIVALIFQFLSNGPVTSPQFVRMLTGLRVDDPRFVQRYRDTVVQVARRLAPDGSD